MSAETEPPANPPPANPPPVNPPPVVDSTVSVDALYAALAAVQRRQSSAMRHGLWNHLEAANDDARRIRQRIDTARGQAPTAEPIHGTKGQDA